MAAVQITTKTKPSKVADATAAGWAGSDADSDLALDAFEEEDEATTPGDSSSSDDDDEDDDDDEPETTFVDFDTGEDVPHAVAHPSFPGREVKSIAEYKKAIFASNSDYVRVRVAGRPGVYRGVAVPGKVYVLASAESERAAISHLPMGKDKLTPHFATKVVQSAIAGKNPVKALVMSSIMNKVFGKAVGTVLPPIMNCPLALEIKKLKPKKKKRKRAEDEEGDDTPKSKSAKPAAAAADEAADEAEEPAAAIVQLPQEPKNAAEQSQSKKKKKDEDNVIVVAKPPLVAAAAAAVDDDDDGPPSNLTASVFAQYEKVCRKISGMLPPGLSVEFGSMRIFRKPATIGTWLSERQ
jgi:hypothetical protein